MKIDWSKLPKILIPTFKHRPNSIIDYVRDWDNVIIVTDQEDYDENYKDFPKEKTWIVPIDCRSQYAKRKLITEKYKDWFFMIDDDVCEYGRVFNFSTNKLEKVPLEEVLVEWFNYAKDNNLYVTSPGMSITTGHFNAKQKKLSMPNSSLNGAFLIKGDEVKSDWWTLDRSIAEDCYFTYNCLKNDVDTRRINYITLKFKNVGLSKSLTITDKLLKYKLIVDTFLACKGFYVMKMTKTGPLTKYDGKTHFDLYDRVAELKLHFPNDYYIRVFQTNNDNDIDQFIQY
jgi:hypothetical protein